MTRASPIPVGKFHTLASGYRIHYHEYGQARTDRPSLLFLHGGGPGASGYSNFKDNAAFFEKHGYHGLLPDCLGFGLSDKPADISYHSVNHVAAMRDLLKAKGISSIVPVGNSLGGGIALHHTMAYPEQVAKLILMAPGGLVDPRKFVGQSEGLQAMFKFARERTHDRAATEPAFRALLALLVHNKADITDAAVAERLDICMEQPMVLYESLQTPFYTVPQLREIKCPVLGFWGRNDKFLPYTQNQVLLEALPSAKVVLSDRAGHWFMIEERDIFNAECLKFLEAA